MRRPAWAIGAACVLVGAPLAHAQGAAAVELAPYVVSGDAIAEPLAGRRGDAAQGRKLLEDRHRSLCILCHAAPGVPEPFQGTLAPSLDGIGARLSEGQIRLRIVDMKRLNRESIMPSYYAIREGVRVAPAWRGRPLLDATGIEHLVAYLVTLKE
ncbi:sulfur oxidation c-type cytochrome SoxX [Ancylobacter sp. G4_0304]|uniref:sulfur oxidation c-type cytochrome SoxX n=1 Tax=Ancylobacter sp. G4_0304 TaxID=3114289 RepID=UPI0039C608E8